MERAKPGLAKQLDVWRVAGAREAEMETIVRNVAEEEVLGMAANPRHLRRRTNAFKSHTSNKSRRPNVKKRGRLEKLTADALEKGEAAPAAFENRAMQRKRARLLEEMTADPPWPSEGDAAPELPALRRLGTHIWHAKRMDMMERWGHLLPEGAFGKGEGSRGLLSKLEKGCIMHDAAYHWPLQLCGPPEALFELLTLMSDGRQAELAKRDQKFQAGCSMFQLNLHHPRQYPRRMIAPASLLFGPESSGKLGVARHLWLWLHAAAVAEFEEAVTELVCELRITVGRREACLGRIDICGGGCDAAVAKLLAVPIAREKKTMKGSNADRKGWRGAADDEQRWHECCQAQGKGFKELPDRLALHLRSLDPRMARPLWEAADTEGLAPAGSATILVHIIATIPWLTRQRLSTSVTFERRGLEGKPSPGLQGSGFRLLLPSRGEALKGNHKSSCASSAVIDDAGRGCGSKPNDPKETLLELACTGGHALPRCLLEKEVSERRHTARSMQQLDQGDSSYTIKDKGPLCPVVAIRRKGRQGNPPFWSLIFPRTWAMPFWTALAMTGVAPAGQRERRWVASQLGKATFPADFPDTRSGWEYDLMRGTDDAAERKLRPNGLYPSPVAMHWHLVGTGGGLDGEDDTDHHSDSAELSQTSLLPPGCYVARSARALPRSQQARTPDSSEASPQLQAPGSTSPASLRDHQSPGEETFGRHDDPPIDTNKGAPNHCMPEECYVRVRLKFVPNPGTAEFGARVYDPHAEPGAANATVQLSNEGDGQDSLYLKETQIPKASPHIRGQKVAGHTLMGYVVAGEVRGCSKNRGGSALLRLDLLNAIRHREEAETKGFSEKGPAVKKGCLRVLVQNPRSSVAHMAVATIVLETAQGEQALI